MIDVIADLHLHSKYSRAVSPQMVAPTMAQFGEQKGIDVLGTGDFTHPLWMRELKSYLTEAEEGLFKIKNPKQGENEKTRFLLSVEIATIFSQKGKGRRIHQVILMPSLASAEKFNSQLVSRGYNLTSDGRPIIGLSSKNLLQLMLETDERALFIPAHIWTPWFGMYGQMSGFESLSEAFEEVSPYVYAIETGLSSDPEMNWQIDELKTCSIVSFSDAHSPAKMGREATVFRLEELSYENIRQAIMRPSKKKQEGLGGKEGKGGLENKVLYTIEFYPEEGKYHYSGHRNCNITMTPEEQKKAHSICPVCHRKVTDGVMRRVQELAQEELRGLHKENKEGLTWVTDPKKMHPPFVKIVPLLEIIAESIHSPVGSIKVKACYEELIKRLGAEFEILLKIPIEEITDSRVMGAEKIAQAIQKVRSESIVIQPGYDGVFGVVKIWSEEPEVPKETKGPKDEKKEQIGLGF